MKSDSPTPNGSSPWDICPPGLLQETAKVVPPRHGNGWWIATVLMFGLLIAGGVAWTNGNQSAPEPVVEVVEIDCQFVQQHLVAFIKNEGMDCDTYMRMGCHIRHCKCCCAKYKCLNEKTRRDRVLLKTPATNSP